MFQSCIYYIIMICPDLITRDIDNRLNLLCGMTEIEMALKQDGYFDSIKSQRINSPDVFHSEDLCKE